MVDARMLDPYIENGVLSLKELKKGNVPLSKYVDKYKNELEDRLCIDILDDTKAIRGINTIKKYLRYTYGNTVNLSNLRRNNIVLYNNICALGNPEEVVTSLGFKSEYDSKISQDKLIEELEALANEDGLITKLTKKLDNKIRYEANKEGITRREYIEKLGFFLDYRGKLTRITDSRIERVQNND